MINKRTLETTYQKKVDFILKPLAIGNDNRVYFVQQDVGQQKFVLKAISAINFAITNVGLVSLPAEPEVVAVSDSKGGIYKAEGLDFAEVFEVYRWIL